MHFCSIGSRYWKTILKTVIGMLSLLTTVFIFSIPVDAVTQWKTAVIRASDGHVYEIEYTKPLNVEDFYIHGEGPSREVAAELYLAAGVLNRPLTASDIYSGKELVNWVHSETNHTAIWKNYHRLATLVGSASMSFLVGALTSGLEITTSLIQTEAVQGAVQALTTLTLLVGEEQVMGEAYITASVFAERAFNKKRIFDGLVLLAENETEISIEEIKWAYNALLQADLYVKWVHWLMKEHLILPDRQERLVNFVLTVSPLTSLGYFFVSAGKNIEDLQDVRTVFHETGSQIAANVSVSVDTAFGVAMKGIIISTLESKGFFDRQPPVVQPGVITERWLMPGGDARHVDMTTTFSDPNGDPLTFQLKEGWDRSIAAIEWINLSVHGESASRRMLKITPENRVGETSVTVVATDTTRLSVEHTFRVVVAPANSPPQISKTLPRQLSLKLGSSSPQLDLDTYFYDLDSEGITYESVSDDTTIATVHPPDGSLITISASDDNTGAATVTVTATDTDGASTIQTIAVTVYTEPAGDDPGGSDRNFLPPINLDIKSDLEIKSLQIRPSEFEPGDPFEIKFKVKNNGPGESAQTEVSLYYSPDKHSELTDLDEDRDGKMDSDFDLYVAGAGKVSVPALAEGESSDILSLTVEAPSKPDRYYYGVLLPYSTGDLNIDAINNNLRVTSVTVTSIPDLIVSSISISEDRPIYPGDPFTLRATVRNQGLGRPKNSPTLRYYESSNTNISRGDNEVGTVEISRSRLDTNEESNKPIPLTAPEPGVYHYGACVDSVTNESNTRNNCSASDMLRVKNYAPRAIGTISEQSMPAGISIVVLEVSDYFEYTNRNTTYTAESSDTEIVEAEVSNGFLSLTTLQSGHETITITASDGERGATQTFEVTVLGEEAWMPDAELRFRVRNALGLTANEALTPTALTGLTTLKASNYTPSDPSDLTGLEYATQLRDLNLSRTLVSDLTPLAGLTQLRKLGLSYTNVSDLTPLQGLVNLTSLTFHQAFLLGSIRPLSGLTNLTILDIGRTGTTDITPLQGLTNLTYLNLSFNNIDDFTPLRGLTALTSLNLGYTGTTDITLLQGMTALTSLNLENNQIPNIAPLRGLTQLTSLYLKSNKISDVSPLEGLTALQILTLAYNPIVDPTPLESLKAKNPNLKIELPNYPDLVVDSVEINKNKVDLGGKFQLDVAIRNQGTGVAGVTSLHCHISSDETISAKYDGKVHTIELPILAVGATHELSVELTPFNRPGVYYYGVCIDAAVFEKKIVNNCSEAVPITVEAPQPMVSEGVDLVVEIDPSATKTTVKNDESFQISTRVLNKGKDSSRPTKLNFYQSEDETIAVEDTLIGSIDVPALSGKGTAGWWKTRSAPNTPGTYYYGVCIDAVEGESDTTNNCSQAIEITVENLAPIPVGTIPPQTLSVDDQTRTVDVAAYFTDPNKTPLTYTAVSDKTEVATVDVNGSEITITRVRAGDATVTVTASDGELTAPQSFSVSVTETVAKAPDLRLVSVKPFSDTPGFDKDKVAPGEAFWLHAVLTNQGNADAGKITVRYYLSTDDTISTTDTPLKTATLEATLAGKSHGPSVPLTAPDTPGTYYYGVCIDPVEGESDTTNNCSEAITLTVEDRPPAPDWDLRIEGTPEVSGTTFAPGESFEITTHVWNKGNAVSEVTTLHYYLSTDAMISAEDTLLSNDSISALSGKGAHPSRRRAELLATLTAPDTPGTYYLGVCIDAIDADTSNNCSQAIEITVAAPAPEPVVAPVPGDSGNPEPVEIQGPDLVFSMTRVDASTIKVFAGVRFHITLTNQGTEMAAATMIRYYRSEDATISAEDTELRAVPIGQLGAGKSQTTWALLPGSTSVGTYYYGACVDGVDSEFDTTNNCSDGIEITVVPLHEDTGTLKPTGTISQQALEIGDSPIVLDVARNFIGKVEDYTASAKNLSIVSVSMSGSEVTVTPVAEGWTTVTITASSGDLVAKQTFSVSVGVDLSGPDTSPEVYIPSASLRAAIRSALGLAEGDTITEQKMAQLSFLRSTFKQVDDLTGLEHATNLTELQILENPTVFPDYATFSDLTPLANLTALRFLSIRGTHVRDLTPLANLAVLTRLSISYSQVSDLTPLANLTALTNLEVVSNQVSDLMPLANLTALIDLHLSVNQISDLTPLANLTTLTRLQLSSNQISDLTPLTNLTALSSHLDLSGNQIDDITPLRGLTALKSLALKTNQIRDVSPLENLTALTHLYLEGNPIVDLAPLRRLKEKNPGVNIDIDPPPDTSPEVSIPDANLRTLVRRRLGLAEGDTLTQQKMTRLYFVRANNKQINDLTGLEHATNLTELRIDQNQFSDLTPLANLTKLRLLTAGHSQVSDLKPLANLTKLTTLSVSLSKVSDLTPLSNLTKLTSLGLSGNQISDLKPLSNLTKLTNLELHRNQVSDLKPLASLTTLTRLELGYNQISDLKPLASLTALSSHLDLSGNQISDITPLQGLTALKSLGLANNKITNVSSLEKLTALTWLYLQDNEITDVSSLEKLTAVTHLHLQNNEITNVSPLENLTTLTSLSLDGNPIADLAPLRRLKEKIEDSGGSINIDVDINADLNNAPAAPSAPLLPAETALFSNYPNPFNPETWIPYQLAAAADVTVTIYDVRGGVVRRLVLGHRPPGFYYSRGRAAHWDGRNALGEKVASGLYFYTFTAGDFTATQKLLIRK